MRFLRRGKALSAVRAVRADRALKATGRDQAGWTVGDPLTQTISAITNRAMSDRP